MLSKTKWIAGVTTTFGTQIVLIPVLSSKDSKIKSVTFAGSSSLFDLFEKISNNRKNTSSIVDLNRIDFVILPTGSTWSREALKRREIDLALVSTKREDSIYGKPGTSLPQSATNVILRAKEFLTEQDINGWGLADDPIIFLFHEKGNICDNLLRGGGHQKYMKS